MEFNTKYNVGDEVYVIKHSKIDRKTINSVTVKQGCSSANITYTFAEGGCGSSGSVWQHEIFATKQELLDSL